MLRTVRIARALSERCECCERGGCETCVHALGWHQCAAERAAVAHELAEGDELAQRWRAGTLYRGQLDAQSTIWELAKRRVPLDVMIAKLDT